MQVKTLRSLQAMAGVRWLIWSVRKYKNRRQFWPDAGWKTSRLSLRLSWLKAEVGSIRLRPVGGGLGVYEPVPDRTVSGNTRKFVGHWGDNADKKGRECGKESPIPTHRSQM
ncbi:hypothetical protein [Mesorhizobium amorphae]|uniref:hypothetical protein n=1 Tax=Mesorhizobium amorphae TaxID=71433 RepID=UPI001186F552|nr:hypothetical protein [Mesorhizobium amorphae]